MNLFGILIGLATFFIIGFGFVWVIRGERYFGLYWWPYVLSFGILVVLASLFVRPDWGSALVGGFGASIVWGATELKEQAIRAELGWFPFKDQKIEPPLKETISAWKAPHL